MSILILAAILAGGARTYTYDTYGAYSYEESARAQNGKPTVTPGNERVGHRQLDAHRRLAPALNDLQPRAHLVCRRLQLVLNYRPIMLN